MVGPSTQLPVSPKTTITESTGTLVKWDSRYAGHVPHDTSYYSKCVLGGILACGLTHTAVCPLDVTKCNMQVCYLLNQKEFFLTIMMEYQMRIFAKYFFENYKND
jgi:hypothetical protein